MPYRPAKQLVSDQHFILIVDHLRIQRTALRYLLQDEYRLAFAEGAQEAIELVKAHRPDLIVMDHLLPYLDVWEAARTIRRQGYTGPIIVTTAFPTPEDSQKANEFPALDYVAKPLDVFEFQTLVRTRTQEHADQPAAERTAKSCG
jgi:CheY-like chemotaxis protein